MSDAPIFLDSQEDSLPYLPSRHDTSSFSKTKEQLLRPGLALTNGLRQSHGQLEVPGPITRPRSHQGTPDRATRKTGKKDLTPKLRHDDSQIQFAAIESSPLDGMVLDSQLLTDRQREVKERQAETAAMFPDLRSSPRIKQKSNISSLISNSTPLGAEPSSSVQPTTPIIAGPDRAPFDDYVTSSPTPRRGQVDYAVDSDIIDPPSSPPEQHARDNVDIPKLSFISSQLNEEDMDSNMWDVTSFPSATIPDPESFSTDLGPSAQIDPTIVIDTPVQLTSLESSITRPNEVDRSTEATGEPSTSAVSRHISSPRRSEFVDALSSPVQASDEVYVDAASSPGKPSTHEQAAVVAIEEEAMALGSTTDLITDARALSQDSPSSIRAPQPISSPMSDMDDDSMLRLITKFDNAPRPQQSNLGSVGDHSTKINKHKDAAVDESDCITVEIKDLPADLAVDLDQEPKPPLFLRRTRTTPWNLKNTVRSTIPDTPARPESDSLPNVDSGPMTSNSPDEASRGVKAVTKATSQGVVNPSRTKKRRSIKGIEIESSELNKRRRTESDEDTAVPGGHGHKTTGTLANLVQISLSYPDLILGNVSSRVKKRVSSRTVGHVATRSSPRVATRTQNIVDTTRPVPSLDFDAPMQDSDAESEAIASQLLSSIADAAMSTSQVPVESILSSGEVYMESNGSQALNTEQDQAAVSVPSPKMVQPQQDLRALDSSIKDGVEVENEVRGAESVKEMPPRSSMISRFKSFIDAMRSVSLTREEAKEMEDLDWDFKAELIAAERRGRQKFEAD